MIFCIKWSLYKNALYTQILNTVVQTIPNHIKIWINWMHYSDVFLQLYFTIT